MHLFQRLWLYLYACNNINENDTINKIVLCIPGKHEAEVHTSPKETILNKTGLWP
jgi:hypothetical protein